MAALTMLPPIKAPGCYYSILIADPELSLEPTSNTLCNSYILIMFYLLGILPDLILAITDKESEEQFLANFGLDVVVD